MGSFGSWIAYWLTGSDYANRFVVDDFADSNLRVNLLPDTVIASLLAVDFPLRTLSCELHQLGSSHSVQCETGILISFNTVCY